MNHKCDWKDFYYKAPPPLSEQCIEDLLAIGEEKHDLQELFREWESKFFAEVSAFRRAVLDNCSNFAFLLKFLGGKHRAEAKQGLDTFLGKGGFFFADGKYVCNYKKSLSFIEKIKVSEYEEAVNG